MSAALQRSLAHFHQENTCRGAGDDRCRHAAKTTGAPGTPTSYPGRCLWDRYLLGWLLDQVPGAEAYGVDASEDMLAQARIALKDQPQVHLERVKVGTSEAAGLPFSQETFDLITCTNALHDMPEPVATLSGLRRLLAPGGQLVVEDFARRERPFPWAAFAWLLLQIEGSPVHAYTLAEAQSLCQQAGLSLARGKAFRVDWFWRGWVVRTELPPKPGPHAPEVAQAPPG